MWGRKMPDQKQYLKYLRWVLLFLVFFDLVISFMAFFMSNWAIDLGKLNSDYIQGAIYRCGKIEPIFMRGTGVLWLLAAYVQFLAWRDPLNRLLIVNIAIIFRFCGATFELIEVLFLLPRSGFNAPLLYQILGVFVTGDYLFIAAMIYLLKKLDQKWWRF